MAEVTRKDINEYISDCLKSTGKFGKKIEVAFGGDASKSGIYQGEKIEGFGWGGDFVSLAHARKVALPGDWLDCYIYQKSGRDWELDTNIVIRIPDPSRGIQGQCYEGAIRDL